MARKDENKMKEWKIFMPWNFEKEQEWLEEKAREGWMLEKSFFTNHFVKAEPQEMVYRVDYFSILNEKKLKRYRAVFEESGWEFVYSSFGWHYFRIPADQFSTEIYSAPPSRIEQLKRINEDAVGFFVLYLMLMITMSDFDGWDDLIFFALMGAMLVWGAIYTIKIREKITTLNETLDEDERINPDM